MYCLRWQVQLRRGTVYIGSNHRLRAAIKKGMEGKGLKIGVIGRAAGI